MDVIAIKPNIIFNNILNAFKKSKKCIFYMATVKPKLLTASDFKAEQKKWNNATAKTELVKLIINNKIKAQTRKSGNVDIVDVDINWDKFIFTCQKKQLLVSYIKSSLNHCSRTEN